MTTELRLGGPATHRPSRLDAPSVGPCDRDTGIVLISLIGDRATAVAGPGSALRAELGGIKKLLMGGAVQKTMDAEVEATERLKSLLESVPDG